MPVEGKPPRAREVLVLRHEVRPRRVPDEELSSEGIAHDDGAVRHADLDGLRRGGGRGLSRSGRRREEERGHGERALYEPEPLPEGRTTIAEEYIHHLERGEPLHPTLEMAFNLEVMAILDAGVRSASSGALERVDSATWCIG